jgi:tape measure domain-containing protein
MATPIRQEILINATDLTGEGLKSVDKNLKSFQNSISAVDAAIVGLLSIDLFANAIRGFASLADQSTSLRAKIQLVSNSQEEYTKTLEELTRVSKENGSAIADNTALYTRVVDSIKGLGKTSEDAVNLTQLLSDGLIVSGASASETSSTIIQLSQALASGVLRGEEFNSLTENGVRIQQALSDSLGVSIGALREMAGEGLLTSEIVIDALLSQGDVLRAEAESIPLTFGRALENIKTQTLVVFTEFTSVFEGMAKGLSSIGEGIKFFGENSTEVSLVALAAIGLLSNAIINNGKRRLEATKLEKDHLVAIEKSANDQKLIERQASIREEQSIKRAERRAVIQQNKENTDARLGVITSERDKENAKSELASLKRKELLLDNTARSTQLEEKRAQQLRGVSEAQLQVERNTLNNLQTNIARANQLERINSAQENVNRSREFESESIRRNTDAQLEHSNAINNTANAHNNLSSSIANARLSTQRYDRSLETTAIISGLTTEQIRQNAEQANRSTIRSFETFTNSVTGLSTRVERESRSAARRGADRTRRELERTLQSVRINTIATARATAEGVGGATRKVFGGLGAFLTSWQLQVGLILGATFLSYSESLVGVKIQTEHILDLLKFSIASVTSEIKNNLDFISDTILPDFSNGVSALDFLPTLNPVKLIQSIKRARDQIQLETDSFRQVLENDLIEIDGRNREFLTSQQALDKQHRSSTRATLALQDQITKARGDAAEQRSKIISKTLAKQKEADQESKRIRGSNLASIEFEINERIRFAKLTILNETDLNTEIAKIQQQGALQRVQISETSLTNDIKRWDDYYNARILSANNSRASQQAIELTTQKLRETHFRVVNSINNKLDADGKVRVADRIIRAKKINDVMVKLLEDETLNATEKFAIRSESHRQLRELRKTLTSEEQLSFKALKKEEDDYTTKLKTAKDVNASVDSEVLKLRNDKFRKLRDLNAIRLRDEEKTISKLTTSLRSYLGIVASLTNENVNIRRRERDFLAELRGDDTNSLQENAQVERNLMIH